MSLPREGLFNVLNETFDLSQNNYLKMLPDLEKGFFGSDSTQETRLQALTLAVGACSTFTNFPGTDTIFKIAESFEKYLNGEDPDI